MDRKARFVGTLAVALVMAAIGGLGAPGASTAAVPGQDIQLGEVELVSLNQFPRIGSVGGVGNPDYGPAVSAGGRYVVYLMGQSNFNPSRAAGFITDMETATLSVVGLPSAGGSDFAKDLEISPDARYVLFSSTERILMPDANNGTDIFLHDRSSGTTERVMLADDDSQMTNYLDTAFSSPQGSMSDDARFIAWQHADSNITPTRSRILVRDRLLGTTVNASPRLDGQPATSETRDPVISGNGRYVAYWSTDQNFVPNDITARDVFVRDLLAESTELVSVSSDEVQSNGVSTGPIALSADGRFVAFPSTATNLVPGDTNGYADIFVRDRLAGTTERVSVSSSGAQANYPVSNVSISADGRYVVFDSLATTLVAGDTNNNADVFLHDRDTGITTRVSVTSDGGQGNNQSRPGRVSPDGSHVVFSSAATNILPDDTNGWSDVFRVPITASTPTTVRVLASQDQSAAALMAALAAEIPELEILSYDTEAGTYTLPACSTTTSPIPRDIPDYEALLGGMSFTSLLGSPVPPVTPDCVPDAVTVSVGAP